jgi:hypothetical protein
VAGTARTFADWASGFQSQPNTLATVDQAKFRRAGGDPSIFYLHGYWEVAADEALVIDTPVPECEVWNFQLNNYWMESLDYRHHTICINKHSARYDANGGVTLILSAHNPGKPNWLDTAGHRNGTMCWRWVGAAEPVHPVARVVKLETFEEAA